MQQPLRILQVSTYDVIGGAEKVAWNLFRAYRARGHRSWLAVGRKLGDDPDVLPISDDKHHGPWSQFWTAVDAHLFSNTRAAMGRSKLQALLRALADPGRALDKHLGREDFRFPATWQLLRLPPDSPDLVHCHNLHGGYFDLRVLPWLSTQVPLILTLHDAWLLSGHCAHSLGCERWQNGCGHCPDLTIEPAIQRDATAYNWRRKRTILSHSNLHIATPCDWLMDKVAKSYLASSVLETRVIPNGVDLTVFHPGQKEAVRAQLAIPRDAAVLLFAATSPRQNPWKDYRTIRAAITLASDRLYGRSALFLAVGESAPPERIGDVELRFVPYQSDADRLARYYQAADVYVHAALADTFPNTVLEALACGTPVVATAMGGIREQVIDGQTGYLVAPGDATALAARFMDLLYDESLREFMAVEAVRDARRRFDLKRQADTYLEWYHALVESKAPPFVNRPFHALPIS